MLALREIRKFIGARRLPQVTAFGDVLLFSCILLFGLATRLFEIGHSFDTDEIFSILIAKDTMRGVVLRSLHDGPHPPLHNMLLHFWTFIWGPSEIAARTLSVLLSLGCLSFVIALLKPRVSLTMAATGGLIVAFSGFFTYYGQEARPYALIEFAGAFNLWSFFYVLDTPQRTWRIWVWAASALLLVFSHYIGAVYLFVEGSVLLLRHPFRAAMRAIVPAMLGGCAVLPWMYYAFKYSPTLPTLGWMGRPQLRDIPYLYLGSIGWPPSISGYVLLGILVVVFALAIVNWRRKAQPISWEILALIAVAIISPAVAFVLSYLTIRSIWAPRQLIVSSIAFVILLVWAADTFSKPMRWIAALLFIGWAVAGNADGWQRKKVPPMRDIVNEIEQRDSSAVILGEDPWATRPLRYYAVRPSTEIMGIEKYTRHSGQDFYLICRPGTCPRFDHRLETATLLRRDDWWYMGGRPLETLYTYHVAAAYE